MNHLFTKLTKAFIYGCATLVFIVQLTSCGTSTNENSDVPTPLFLGKWKIKSIKPARYADLDETQRKIYEDEMKKMLDSSYFVFNADSTYAAQTGPDAEKGKWISDKAHTKLVLLSSDSIATRYFIKGIVPGSKILRLKNIDSKDSVEIDLEKVK